MDPNSELRRRLRQERMERQMEAAVMKRETQLTMRHHTLERCKNLAPRKQTVLPSVQRFEPSPLEEGKERMPRLDRKGVHAALWMQDKQEKFYGGLDFAMSYSDQVRFLRVCLPFVSCALSSNHISIKDTRFCVNCPK